MVEVQRVHFSSSSMVIDLAPAEVEQVDFRLRPVRPEPLVLNVALAEMDR